MKKPRKTFYSINEVAEEWSRKQDCEITEADIISYAAEDKLQLGFWVKEPLVLDSRPASGNDPFLDGYFHYRKPAPLPSLAALHLNIDGRCVITQISTDLKNEAGDFILANPKGGVGVTVTANLLCMDVQEKARFERAELMKDVNQESSPTPKSRAAYLRLIASMARALTGQDLNQPHKAAQAVLAALSAKGVEATIGDEALAGYLKEASKL